MDLRPRRGLSLCSGGGGLDLGLMLAEPGYETACFVEWEPACRETLIAAQRAGYFMPAPIWDDVTSFDGRPFRGQIDTLLAGYPCQPFSTAGKRLAESDERHLWPDIARIIGELKPLTVLLENVAGHVELGLETVLRELRGMGYAVACGLFSAGETNAAQERLRLFILARRDGELHDGHGEFWPRGRFQSPNRGGPVPATLADACGDGPSQREPHQDPGLERCAGGVNHGRPFLHPPGPDELDLWRAALAARPDLAPALALNDVLIWAADRPASLADARQAPAQSALCRMVDGLARRARALKMLGNGVHPLAAGHAVRSLGPAVGLWPLDLGAALG